MFEVGAVQGADTGERVGARGQPHARPVRAHQAHRATVDRFSREAGVHRAGFVDRAVRSQSGQELLGSQTSIHAMNGVDAQLLLDELGHIGHRQLGAGVGAAGAAANLIAEDSADRIAVMAVGDQHGVGRHRRTDGLDTTGSTTRSTRWTTPLIVGALADGFARFGEQLAQAGGQRQAPDR